MVRYIVHSRSVCWSESVWALCWCEQSSRRRRCRMTSCSMTLRWTTMMRDGSTDRGRVISRRRHDTLLPVLLLRDDCLTATRCSTVPPACHCCVLTVSGQYSLAHNAHHLRFNGRLSGVRHFPVLSFLPAFVVEDNLWGEVSDVLIITEWTVLKHWRENRTLTPTEDSLASSFLNLVL